MLPTTAIRNPSIMKDGKETTDLEIGQRPDKTEPCLKCLGSVPSPPCPQHLSGCSFKSPFSELPPVH